MISKDDSLGRAIRTQAMKNLRDRSRNKPGIEPDEQTRELVAQIVEERARYGPKQIVAYAAFRYGVELDLEMVRGALHEIATDG